MYRYDDLLKKEKNVITNKMGYCKIPGVSKRKLHSPISLPFIIPGNLLKIFVWASPWEFMSIC